MFSQKITSLKNSKHPQIAMVGMLNDENEPSQKMKLLEEILFDMNLFRVLIATRVNLVYLVQNLAEPYSEKICDQFVNDPQHYELVMKTNIDLQLANTTISNKLPGHAHFFQYKNRDTAVAMIKARRDAIKQSMELTEKIIPFLIKLYQSTLPNHLTTLPNDIFKLVLKYLFDQQWIAPIQITESINQAYQAVSCVNK